MEGGEGDGGGWRGEGERPPPPKMLSSIITKMNREIENQKEKPKTKILLVFYNGFHYVYQKMNMILWSIRTFWYKGSAKNDEKMTNSKKESSPQK